MKVGESEATVGVVTFDSATAFDSSKLAKQLIGHGERAPCCAGMHTGEVKR